MQQALLTLFALCNVLVNQQALARTNRYSWLAYHLPAADLLSALSLAFLRNMQVVSVVAGGLAGALTATFVCPLDVLKTRMQVQRRVAGVKYAGIGGARGLGLGLPLQNVHLISMAAVLVVSPEV